MAQDPTRISPTDYSASAYDILSKYDPAFSENVSVEGFFENLQNPEYAAKAYAILADADPELVNNLSLDEFFSNVKKKEEPAVTESVSDVGSSEQRLASRDLEAERVRRTPVIRDIGFQGAAYNYVPPTTSEYYTPAEQAKRDSIRTERDIREADIQAQRKATAQEMAELVTADLAPVTIPEGNVPGVVSQLSETYGPYGIEFSEEKVPMATTRQGARIVKAIAKGPGGKPVEMRLALDEGGNIAQSEADKLDDFVRTNARVVGETDESFVEKSLRLQELRPVARLDSSGVSTVKMAWGEMDGKYIAYPTLFPKDPDITPSTNPNDWMELGLGAQAMNEAEKRGELFFFDTAVEAAAFADGKWKNIVPEDVEFQRRAQELGRDYDADMAFLDEVDARRAEYRFLEELIPGTRYEKEIPADYDKYFIDGNLVRDDIEAMRAEKEAELSTLEGQFDSDNVLLRFKEDRDVALGKKYDELKTEAATINNEAKAMQNRLQVQSISQFGVRLEDLVDYEPKSQQELTDMINMYRQYGDAAAQRQAAALGYEKAMTYYDKQYDKGVTEEYVDGWEEVSVAWSNGLKRGNAMSKLLLMQFGYYDVFGDDGAEEQAMREVSAIMDSQDKRRGRIVSRANMTGTTDSYLNSIASNPAMYTAAITAESLSQLVPIWGRVLPAGVALGGAYGLAGGPVGVLGGGFTGLLGGAVAGITAVGMPVSELALELGNATLEAGESRGYDWADPNSALKALNDEEMWAEASDRGWKRGVPIMLTGILSNYFIGKAVSGSARLATRGERMARGIGTGLVVEPATEALGERIALGVVGDYTGSTQNFKEIMAEAIGAVGMGMSMGAAFGAVGYAKQVLGESNFDLGVRLMTPEGLAQENVSNERIVEWANKMETLGQLTPEQANAIRKNTGLRRDANELLGRRPGARPGTKGRVVGRLMELLQAKETLESRGPNAKQVFGKRISEINEEIAYIAENSALPEKRVNLEGLGADIPASYKFNGKSVTREDFLAQIQEATPKQLKKAKVYGDPQTKQELDTRRNAIQKREAAEVPVGEQPGVSPPVDEQVREATQEDLQAEEQGTLDPDRKAVILESIAEKLNDEVELNEVEQAFLEDNKEDIEADQKRLETLDQEAAEVEVLGEPEVQGRIPLKRLKRLASNAKKALAKNFPDANIIIHNDKASYQQAAQENGLTGERSAGFIGTDDKTIHIFAPLASETTVAHETFHAILRNTIDSAQIQELMGEFVTTLKKVIPADKPLAAKLDKYQQLYDAGQMNEEYVAEFFGELAAAYPTLDRKGKSVIARFLERLGKLLGVELTLSPDLTARDKQIISLLERLAGQVSRGETVTARETEALRSLTTDRQQTEENLGAAEQKVDDFSDEQMESMAKQGVAFHFGDVDITKVLPEKLKRTIYGYGFYTTSAGQSNSVFRRYGDRVTLIDLNQLNLLDGDTRITEEQAKKLRDFAKMELEELDETGELVYFPEKAIVLQSLAELKAGAAWANVLIEGSAEAVFGDVKMVPREIANRSTTPDVITYDIPQQAQVAALIQEAFGFDGADFGRAVNMDETGYGIISAIWNFDKLNRAIIEPGQEPTRAAEQRVDIKTDGTGIDIEGNEPVKAGQISPTVRIDATEKRDAFLEDDFRFDDIDGTITSRVSAAVGTARRLASGKVVYTKDGVKYTIELPYENKRLLSLLNRRSNAVAAVKGDGNKAKAKRAKLLERVKETTNEILAEAVEVMTQNVLAVYDTLTPEFVAASKEWYVGANRVANRMAEIYGVTVEEAAGVLAALSPQNDWFNNIAVAERTFEVLENHSDTPFSREVFDKALALNMDRKGPSKWGKQLAAEFAQYEGMTLNEMEAQGVPVTVQTNLLRAIDQAMYPGKVLMTTPDGDFIGFDSTPIRWSSPVEIAKAMDMYRNPSIENIREQLGGGNKVRNFYNNIVDPNSTSPYVTADTHAASVALGIPMSANDAGGFGVFKGGRSIEYALIKEAYINAAEIAGILPREMQSITWEAQRTGINNKNRTASEIKANVELLKRLLNDETLTPYERTRRIIAENPSENPGWATSRGIEAQLSDLLEGIEAQAESRGREVLSVRRGAGRDVGDAAARVGEPAAEGRAAEQRGAQAAEQRVYRAGDLVNKVEPRSEALSGRSTGHFGTGFYFFGDKSAAESNAERTNRPVTELDITDYRLAPASYFLHAALQEVNKRAMKANREGRPHTIAPKEIQYAQVAVEQGPSFRDFYYMNDALRIYKDQLLDESTARRIAAEATRLYNEPGNVDSPSTSVMKALGYEGVNAVGTELDNYTYGTVIYDVKPGAAEQRVSVDTEGPTIVYRSGAVDSKAEPRGMMSGGRSTGHFGTGAYFFGDRKQAEEYDDREVTAVDIRDYNLAPASMKLHDALRDVNTTYGREKDEFSESDFFRVIMALGRYDEFYAEEQLDIDASDEVLQEQIRRNSEVQSRRTKLRSDAKRMYNEPGNVDSRSTVVMKVLGYDGVYATPGSDMDNATYGTVIYDVKPGAAEQRVSENEAENTKLPSTLKEAQAQGLLMHGANAAFAAFSPAYIRGGSRARLGYGFYFTDDATKARDYGSYDVYVDKSNLNMFELSEEDGTKIDVEGLLRMAAEEMTRDEPRMRAEDVKSLEERYLKEFYDAVNDAEENSDTPMETSIELIRMYNRRQIGLMTLGAAVLDIAQLDVTNSERAIRIANGYLPPDGGGVRALSVLFMSAGFDGYYVGGVMTPMREAVVFNIPKLNESIVNAVPRKSGAEQRISEPLHDAAVRYNVNEKGFMPNDAPTENIIQFGKMLAKEGFGLGRASNGSRYVTRNGRLFRIFEAYRKQRSEDIQDRIEYEAEQRARELEERIIEIYNADERPYTGKDFEGRAAEQKVVVEAMAEPATIADLVARGRELGLRDASIRSVLLKRFGKDNADAIDTALTEYFDMFRAIPEAFGNVEGGIEVGRQIYDDVRRQLDEFARPKKPGRMTTRERTDRIAELRAKFPEQKKLSDTELLRRHPRQAVAPAIADVRAEALNLLRNNRLFNEQTTEVQEQLLVAFDKTLQTRANKQVNTLISQIRNNIRQRRKGAKNARTVQTQLRKLINEVLPRGKYGKRDINRLNKLVAEVNEDNYFDKAEEVLKIVDKQREAIRQSLLTDIENIVKKAAKTRRTPTGKIRPRSLDAPGQAFFRTALRVLKAARADDATQIENIKANLSHNPEVDEVTQKYLNGETLTSREQQIMDQKSALDIFYEVNGKSIEELEAIIEDLKISAAFSRANLKATRAARAERMAALREGAKESVTRDWGDLAVSEDGTAKSQNQIESDLRKQKSLGEALKTRGMRAKYDALMEWAQEGKRMAPAKIAKNAWSHYGSLTGIMGEFFRENLYKRLGKMEEDYLRGKFKERENLDAMANSIEGITNGFVEIGEIIFTNGDLTVKYGNTSRKFTTDELLRIYALSLNPVQKQRLMLMGFTDEVMADITEFLDDRLIEFADKTVAYLSTDYYEGVNDVHVKVNDVNLPYVENYFPTKTQLEEFFRLDDEQALRSTFFGPNAQLASPLKDRVAQTSEISLKRDLGFHGELTSHINSMERFKAFAEGTQEMNAVLSDSYTTALANLIGAEKAVVMLAAQGVSPERFMSEMRAPLVDKLVSRYTGVSLGYKLMQIPKQASSMFAGIQDYQYGDKKNPIIDRIMWSVDMMRILPGAILEGISLAKYKGPIQQMMEESSTLRSRMEETLEGDLYGLATGASGTATKLSKKDFQKAQKALKGVRKGGAAVTAFGDALGVLGYVPAYQRNRQRGMSKREAIDKFNEYNETQQSRRPGERAPIQIYRDGYRRLLTAFTSSQLLYLNNMIRLTAQINRSVRQGGWRSVSASDLRGLYFNTFGAAFTFAIASNIMLILFGSDEEKEKAWYDVLFSWTKNFFIYPILGSTAESVYNKLMGNQYPKRIALDPLDRVERSMTKAVKDGDFGPAIQNTTEMLIGTNLDPAISLIEVAGGEPLEDEIYDIIGVPKSQRPE